MTSKGHGQSDAWDLRPNLNTSQFSQGTLFGGGKRVGRGPRGYSPERMREVRKTLTFKGPMSPPSLGVPAGERKGFAAVGARRTAEEIARSTVPMHELPEGMTVKTLHAKQAGLGSSTGRSWTLAEYVGEQRGDRRIGARRQHGTGEVRVREQAIRATGKPIEPGALIHELGHAADDKARGGIPWNSMHEVGVAEGTADAYAARHFHDRRGDRAEFDYPSIGRNREQRSDFQSGYNSVRPPTNAAKAIASAQNYAAALRQPSLLGEEPGSAISSHPAYRAAVGESKEKQSKTSAADRRAWRRQS